MVTINTREAFTFPRAYIRGFAVFAEDITASLELPWLMINNEVLNTRLRLHVNGEVYPARSRSYALDEVFDAALSTYEVEALSANLDVNVSIDVPEGHADFRICIKYSGMVETFSLVNLPSMPASYWQPGIS